MKLHSLLEEDMVLSRLEARDRAGVLAEMVSRLENGSKVSHGEAVLDKLLKREEMGTTAIGRGVAVPHCRAGGVKAPVLLLGLSEEGVAFGSTDGKPAHAFFLLVSPQDDPSVSLRILAAIASLTRGSRGLASKLLRADGPARVLEILRAEEEKIRA